MDLQPAACASNITSLLACKRGSLLWPCPDARDAYMHQCECRCRDSRQLLVGSSAHLTEKSSQKLISDIPPTMEGVLLLSQPGFGELTRVDRPSFTLIGWYRSLCSTRANFRRPFFFHPRATWFRVKASWDVPGYVVRKPLGLLGAANALPYARTETAPPIRRVCGRFECRCARDVRAQVLGMEVRTRL